MDRADALILSRVKVLADDFRKSREEIMADALMKARAEIARRERELELAVVDALEAGHSVTDVARAMTPPGSTPNRNKVYDIKARNSGLLVPSTGDYPFRWQSRTTDSGSTVYDVVAVLSDFGPERVTGSFRWTYLAGELEPVLDPVEPPYPNTAYYRRMIEQWMMLNPYPGSAEPNDTE